MARRYSRDNRGRFAPAGSGATARGGRLKTAAGNKRATVTSKSGMVAQGRMTGAPLKGTIGKTSNARLNMGLTRPAKPGQRGAYNEARTQIRANKAATKGARLGGTRKTTKAAAPKNTTPNKTGQSKTLNKFNSRPAGTKIINAKNQLVASSTRVPLKVQGKGANEADRAFARVATKTARSRAKAKPTAKLPREQRLARATATASRIAKKRGQAADVAGAAFAERRRISGRASSKARSAAFAKEAAAGKQSASALRSFQRANNRESNLIAALGRERQAARTGAPKPAIKVGRLQSKEARKDRVTQAKDRKKQANQLKSLPKPVRRAIQSQKIAQRDGYAGAGKSMIKAGLGKKSATAYMSDIQSGTLMLRSDFGKRKGKLSEGQRQAIYNTMIRSGNVLKGRQRTTEVGARIKGMGGARKISKPKRKP
jgi:hypothetical protein